MSKTLLTATMAAVFSLVSTVISAQEHVQRPRSLPEWISEKGFWIIESNIKTPDTSVIHFYNNEKVEVYSENLHGVTLNLKRRKTLMRLKKALDQSLIAWEKSPLRKDKSLVVTNMFKP